MRKLFHQDERGVAHVVMVLLAVVVVAGIGFAAYRVLNKDSKPKSSLSSEEAQKIEDDCKASIDDQDLCKFAVAFAGVETYTAVFETSGANGESTMTIEADGDNSHVTIEAEEGTNETITLGNSSYIKDPTDGQWTKYTSEPTDDADVKADIELDFDESDIPEGERTEYKQLGKEACGNLTCFKYQIIDPTSSDEQFIWFDDEDYLLRKWTTTGGEGSTVATFTYDDVDIKEPSPIKEAATQDGPSEEEIQALMEQYQQ